MRSCGPREPTPEDLAQVESFRRYLESLAVEDGRRLRARTGPPCRCCDLRHENIPTTDHETSHCPWCVDNFNPERNTQ